MGILMKITHIKETLGEMVAIIIEFQLVESILILSKSAVLRGCPVFPFSCIYGEYVNLIINSHNHNNRYYFR